MRNRLQSFIRQERGVASVMVALGMTALLGLAALAIDIGQIHLKRGALQTAADTGALAGANSMMSEGHEFDKIRSIVTNYATRNMVADDKPSLALTNADIVFMNDGVPTEINPNQVEVTVTLSAQRGNPLNLYFGRVLGIDTVDVQVVARRALSASAPASV